MSKKTKDDSMDAVIAGIVEVFSETFISAESVESSSRRYTSLQMAQAIYELTGANVPIPALYQVMTEYGYKYVVDETSVTIKYVWLLKYRV